MNANTFVADFIFEFTSHPECYDDIVDLLDVTLYDIVSNNTIDENKTIIANYTGDVFTAINLYNTHIGDVANLYSDMHIFYEQLAFISLFIKLFPLINCEITKSVNFQSFVVDFTNAISNTNLTELELINNIVSYNSCDTNKQIIFSFSPDISRSINLYKEYINSDINELYQFIATDISIYYQRLAMVVIYDCIQQYAIV